MSLYHDKKVTENSQRELIVNILINKKKKKRIATHPNRLAADTYKAINMDRRLKRKHPADLINDIT